MGDQQQQRCRVWGPYTLNLQTLTPAARTSLAAWLTRKKSCSLGDTMPLSSTVPAGVQPYRRDQ